MFNEHILSKRIQFGLFYLDTTGFSIKSSLKCIEGPSRTLVAVMSELYTKPRLFGFATTYKDGESFTATQLVIKTYSFIGLLLRNILLRRW